MGVEMRWIYNVVGSIIDRYMELSLSSQFNTTILVDLGLFVESHPNVTYTFCYPNNINILDLCSSCEVERRVEMWNTIIINTILNVWILYIGSFYLNYLSNLSSTSGILWSSGLSCKP